MKIKVTYDKDDILKLIRHDLTANGLKHDLTTAVYKGSATVTIDVEGTPSEDVPPEEEPAEVPREPRRVYLQPVPPTDGATPVEDDTMGDMRSIMAESQKNANNKKPMYDPDRLSGRTRLEGETDEWPGSPEPRSR